MARDCRSVSLHSVLLPALPINAVDLADQVDGVMAKTTTVKIRLRMRWSRDLQVAVALNGQHADLFGLRSYAETQVVANEPHGVLAIVEVDALFEGNDDADKLACTAR